MKTLLLCVTFSLFAQISALCFKYSYYDLIDINNTNPFQDPVVLSTIPDPLFADAQKAWEKSVRADIEISWELTSKDADEWKKRLKGVAHNLFVLRQCQIDFMLKVMSGEHVDSVFSEQDARNRDFTLQSPLSTLKINNNYIKRRLDWYKKFKFNNSEIQWKHGDVTTVFYKTSQAIDAWDEYISKEEAWLLSPSFIANKSFYPYKYLSEIVEMRAQFIMDLSLKYKR